VRRTLVLIGLLSALAGSASASAGLTPLKRHFGDVTIPRFRHGHIALPAPGTRGHVQVIATLGLPPLAQAYAGALG